jgi:hypothetical protein
MFDFDRGATVPAVPEQWAELTDAQYYLLVEAFEESVLPEALLGWVLCEAPDDQDAIELHVGRLIAASRCLLGWGLVEVWCDQGARVGEAHAVTSDVGFRVLSDPRSWSYRFGQGPSGLLPTSTAQSLGRGVRRERDSRLARLAHEGRREPPYSEVASALRATR